jgi:predicted esterase
MIIEKEIKTEKTARYYQLGKATNNIKNLWIVFHGYGELAGEFIRNFNVIQNEETLIIAPEALNKFYLRGFYGKVGATWMTTEDRKNEISDYIFTINKIYNKVSDRLNAADITINLLGFSQGTHTAARWLHFTETKVDNLLLWSGTFPHDCNYIEKNKYWSRIKTQIILGDHDKLLSEENIKSEIDFMNSQKLKYKIINYNGDHSLDLHKLISIVNHLYPIN